MSDLRIFDSAAHPTLDGSWTRGRRGQTFGELSEAYGGHSGSRVLAIGMPGVGGYEHRRFKSASDAHGFEAVAALTVTAPTAIRDELREIARHGFRAVKVHPRLLGSNHDWSFLPHVFAECVRNELVCLLCTYEADSPGSLPTTDPYYTVCDALNRNPAIRLVLMHGGVSRLTQFSGLARHSETILLDLSFTMMIDSPLIRDEIRALARRLDQRLCVGSDAPEYSVRDFVESSRNLFSDLDEKRTENVLFGNLNRLFPR